MSMTFDAYMRDVVQPMRDELTRLGVKELRTPEEVTEALDISEGTALVVVNSVCGCAAGNARPAVAQALQHSKVPGPAVHRIRRPGQGSDCPGPGIFRALSAVLPFHCYPEGRQAGAAD